MESRPGHGLADTASANMRRVSLDIPATRCPGGAPSKVGTGRRGWPPFRGSASGILRNLVANVRVNRHLRRWRLERQRLRPNGQRPRGRFAEFAALADRLTTLAERAKRWRGLFLNAGAFALIARACRRKPPSGRPRHLRRRRFAQAFAHRSASASTSASERSRLCRRLPRAYAAA